MFVNVCMVSYLSFYKLRSARPPEGRKAIVKTLNRVLRGGYLLFSLAKESFQKTALGFVRMGAKPMGSDFYCGSAALDDCKQALSDIKSSFNLQCFSLIEARNTTTHHH